MPFTRRKFLAASAVLPGFALVPRAPARPAPFAQAQFCLNTSTIRGFNLGIEEEVDVAANAGYDAIEPWISSLREYRDAGRSLPDLRKRLEDRGLTVESAIGFAPWIVDDDAQRAKGLEEARRDMDLLAQVGGKRLAAPPSGATREPGLDLFKAAARYRALLEIGDEIGVVPQIEIWGFSANLSRLGESMFVALESGHPKACLLADIYHVYRGGSDYTGLGLLSPHCLQVLHVNDYPDIRRDRINDEDRVYPGDGVAPIAEVLRIIRSTGANPVLSLELFNPAYSQKGNALDVARTGLDKMKAAAWEGRVTSEDSSNTFSER